MKLIVESGSSKTDWVLLADTPQSKHGPGLNPYFLSDSQLLAEVKKQLANWEARISEVHFYGAGCGSENQANKVKEAFQKVLGKHLPVFVNTDMLAAARGMCQQRAGIVAILGTGANACLFRLGKVEASAPSNGIWLGDEGSGGYLGKELVKHYLNGQLPTDLQQLFESTFSDRRPEILQQVYRSERPNAYLAGFAPFLHKHRYHAFVQSLLSEAFRSFIGQFILYFPQSRELPIYLVGSIAFHFAENIRAEAEKQGLSIREISPSPLQGLIAFHR